MMIVHDRQEGASIHVEKHNQTDEITGVDTPLAAADEHVFRKTRINAQRHRFYARHEAHDVVEIVLAAFFFPWNSEPRARRVHRLALTQFAKRLFDGVD